MQSYSFHLRDGNRLMHDAASQPRHNNNLGRTHNGEGFATSTEASSRRSRQQLLLAVTLPLLPLLILSGFLCATAAEIELCRPFYGGTHTWWYWEGERAATINEFGVYPPLAMGLVGCLMLAASYFHPVAHRWRKPGWFLVLILAIGPGLVINGVMKPLWGRPRPEELAEFGGSRRYQPIWKINLASSSRSFPSGHAAVAFALIGPAFLFRSRHRHCFVAAVLLAVGYGSAVGLARVAQGAHFPSDILWSAAVNYYTALCLYVLLGLRPSGAHPQDHQRRASPEFTC